MVHLSAIVIALLLGAAEPPATAEQGTRQLEEVIVEEQVEGDFADFEAWDREVRDGLQRATLKQRDELTAHDHEQILILEKEMPVLKRSLAKIKFLVRAHKFRQTLTYREIEQLSEAYRTAEAILENVPDAFMPRCRQLHKYDGRNKVATCDIDYYAIQKQMDEYARKRASGETKPSGYEIASFGAPAPVQRDRAYPHISVASSPPPPAKPEPVHVQADYFRAGQPRVTFAGDTMLRREDFHAIATALPELVPAHALRLELPTGTGMSLGSHDKLQVIGYVTMEDELLRVVSLPRASAVGYGMVVRNDGTFEGTLVAFEYGWSDRRRLAPVNGLRASVNPADARLVTQYDVAEILPDQEFVRYDIVFAGVSDDKVALELRHYDAPHPAKPISSERFEFAATPGRIDIAGLALELREIEPERIKFVVQEASPAAGALASGAR